MTTLGRAVRHRAPPIVVRVRRIKHRTPTPLGPRLRREPPADLSGLILYGQA